jgi:quinone-modifying oxidoreductase subunit QmoA
MEINLRRLEKNPRIEVLTETTIKEAKATSQGWTLKLERAPEYVNGRCTLCGKCTSACPATIPDAFNLNMGKVAAIHPPSWAGWPRRYQLTRSACPSGCNKCVEACGSYEAINLQAQGREETREAAAVVVATGWHPYPLEKLTGLGGGVLPDVVANVQIERMASPAGPTQGKIFRPSNGSPPQRVAFVQCAGSRDVNHLPYCSSVCCLASLKHAQYLREQLPEAEITMFYIDRRTPGLNEEMLTAAAADARLRLIKGKVGKIEQGEGGELVLRVEDIEGGSILSAKADLVVLATGMVPNALEHEDNLNFPRDPDGFFLEDRGRRLFVAGLAACPDDVAHCTRSATGAAAKAMAAARGGV